MDEGALCFSCFIFFSWFLNGLEKQQGCFCHKAFRIKGSPEMADKDSADYSAGNPDPEERGEAPVHLELECPFSAPPNYSLDNRVPPTLIALCFMTSCPG